jgi:hypothetical protein
VKPRLRKQGAKPRAEQFPAAIAHFGDSIDQIRCEQVAYPRNIASVKRPRLARQPSMMAALSEFMSARTEITVPTQVNAAPIASFHLLMELSDPKRIPCAALVLTLSGRCRPLDCCADDFAHAASRRIKQRCREGYVDCALSDSCEAIAAASAALAAGTHATCEFAPIPRHLDRLAHPCRVRGAYARHSNRGVVRQEAAQVPFLPAAT